MISPPFVFTRNQGMLVLCPRFAYELFLLCLYTSVTSELLTRTICCYLPISSNFLSSRSVAKGPPLSPCETSRQTRQGCSQS
jgi:hypothetical protein